MSENIEKSSETILKCLKLSENVWNQGHAGTQKTVLVDGQTLILSFYQDSQKPQKPQNPCNSLLIWA
jgi:hypothetical protein